MNSPTRHSAVTGMTQRIHHSGNTMRAIDDDVLIVGLQRNVDAVIDQHQRDDDAGESAAISKKRADAGRHLLQQTRRR